MNALVLIFLVLLPALVVMAGLIVLEVFLSRRRAKWPGLILPGVSLLLALSVTVALVVFIPGGGSVQTQVTQLPDGTVVTQNEQHSTLPSTGDLLAVGAQVDGRSPSGVIALFALITFLVSNIPTIVFSLIYLACRKQDRHEKELRKMTAQDLT